MIGRKITDQTVSCKVIKPMLPTNIKMQEPIIKQPNPLQSQIQSFHLQSLINQPVPISGRIFGLSKQTVEVEIDFGIENYNFFNRLTNNQSKEQRTNQGLKQQRRVGSRNVTHYFISNKEKPINVQPKKIVHSALNIPQINVEIKNHQPPDLNQSEDHPKEKIITQINQMKETKQIKSIKQMKQFKKQPTKPTINNNNVTNTKRKENSHNSKQIKIDDNKNIIIRHKQQIRQGPVLPQSKLNNANRYNNKKRTKSPLKYMSVKDQIQQKLKRRAECQIKQKSYVPKSNNSHYQLFKKSVSYPDKSENQQNDKLEEHYEFVSREDQEMEQERMSVPEPIQERMMDQKRSNVQEDEMMSDVIIDFKILNADTMNGDEQIKGNDSEDQHPATRVDDAGQKEQIKGGDFNYVQSSSDQDKPKARIGFVQEDNSKVVNYESEEEDGEYEDYQDILQGQSLIDYTNGKVNSQIVHDSSFCEQEQVIQEPTHPYSTSQPIHSLSQPNSNQNQHYSKQSHPQKSQIKRPQQQQCQQQSQQQCQQQCQQQQSQQQQSQQQQSQQDNPRLTEYLRQRNLISSNSHRYPKSVNSNTLTNDLNHQNYNNIQVILELDEEYLQSSTILHQLPSSPPNNDQSSTTHRANQQLQPINQQQSQPYAQTKTQQDYYYQLASPSTDSQLLSHCNSPPPSLIIPHSQQTFPSHNDIIPGSLLSTNKQFSELFTLNMDTLLRKGFINLDG